MSDQTCPECGRLQGVLDALPKVWAAGYTTTEQDGFWHLFAPGGEGIVSAASFRELCAAIVEWGGPEDEQ